MPNQKRKIRLFLSHAFEDKGAFARSLAEQLSLDFEVWFDEYSLTIGDRLLPSIQKGLRECDYGVVLLSPSFFRKKWTQTELEGLFALETEERKVILPVWHDIERSDVAAFSPMLADRIAVRSSEGLVKVVAEIKRAIQFVERDREIQDPIGLKARGISEKLQGMNLDSVWTSDSFRKLVKKDVHRFFSALQEKVSLYADDLSLYVHREDKDHPHHWMLAVSPQSRVHVDLTLSCLAECTLWVGCYETYHEDTYEPKQLFLFSTLRGGRPKGTETFPIGAAFRPALQGADTIIWSQSPDSEDIFTSEHLCIKLFFAYLVEMENKIAEGIGEEANGRTFEDLIRSVKERVEGSRTEGGDG